MKRLAVLLFSLGIFQGVAAQNTELDAVQARLDQLGTRITRLRDISDIEKLQRSYGYYVDKQQWYDIADEFAEDGVYEIGGRGRFIGPDRVFEYLRTGLGPVGPVPGVMHDHQQFQGIVTLDRDGEHAQGRWTAFVMGGTVWGDVTYENDYVKKNGKWMFQYVHAPFNMYSSISQGWVDNTTPNTRPESFPPPPDLPPSVVYLTFPNYYNEPYHYPNPVTGRTAPPPDPAAGGTAFGRK